MRYWPGQLKLPMPDGLPPTRHWSPEGVLPDIDMGSHTASRRSLNPNSVLVVFIILIFCSAWHVRFWPETAAMAAIVMILPSRISSSWHVIPRRTCRNGVSHDISTAALKLYLEATSNTLPSIESWAVALAKAGYMRPLMANRL